MLMCRETVELQNNDARKDPSIRGGDAALSLCAPHGGGYVPAAINPLECLGVGMPVVFFARASLVPHVLLLLSILYF